MMLVVSGTRNAIWVASSSSAGEDSSEKGDGAKLVVELLSARHGADFQHLEPGPT